MSGQALWAARQAAGAGGSFPLRACAALTLPCHPRLHPPLRARLVACTGNFLLFILTSHLPDSTYTRGTGAARCGAAKCGGAGAANVQADATA